MLLYQDGAVIASTVTNVGTYVAMENTSAVVAIGALSEGIQGMDGTMAMVALVAGVLSAAQMVAIKTLVNQYFGLAL